MDMTRTVFIPKAVLGLIALVVTTNAQSLPPQTVPGNPVPDNLARTVQRTCDATSVKYIDNQFLFLDPPQTNPTNSDPATAGPAAAEDQDQKDPDKILNHEYKLARSFKWKDSGFFTEKQELSPRTAYIFLLTRWTADSQSFALESSSWYLYAAHGDTLDQIDTKNASAGIDLPYGFSSAVIVGIQLINVEDLAKKLKDELSKGKKGRMAVEEVAKETLGAFPAVVSYTTSITKGTAENLANLGALIGGLAGITVKASAPAGPGALAAKRPLPTPACFQEVRVVGPDKLPLTVNTAFSLTPGTSAKPPGPTKQTPSAAIDCSIVTKDQPCTFARTFNSVGKEWWDVNVGIALPGITEPKFGFNDKAGTVATSTTRHTDIYGFISLYPFSSLWKKNSYAPHVDVGIPFTGQPLHRPFFGAAEKIPLTEKLLKILGFFYAGACRLIETVPGSLAVGAKTDAATFAGDLRHHIVWKGMYGVEFPVGSLLSKIGKK
jgi:hypothetical protein